MSEPFISLCPEITRAHALTLMDWLEDERVTCYLSDSRHVARTIEQAIDRTKLPAAQRSSIRHQWPSESGDVRWHQLQAWEVTDPRPLKAEQRSELTFLNFQHQTAQQNQWVIVASLNKSRIFSIFSYSASVSKASSRKKWTTDSNWDNSQKVIGIKSRYFESLYKAIFLITNVKPERFGRRSFNRNGLMGLSRYE